MSNMQGLSFVYLVVVFAAATASPALNASGLGDSCTITSASQIASVVASCKTISVGSFQAPAGQTLTFSLQAGTTLSFDGTLTFGYVEWDGPLIWIKGDAVTVKGGANHLINAGGASWWDGSGDHSNKKKPQTMLIQATGGSVFSNIKIKNCPHTCVGITDSHDLTLHDWTIDCKDGDTKGGRNTDGFDVAKSYKVTIKDSSVWNQDDCVCVNQGQNLIFDNLTCTGGHGLSIAVGIWDTYALNTVHNVTFQNSIVQNSRNGIHVKTIAGTQTGEVTDVTYQNIKLSGITYYGVNVQQDYTNDGPSPTPLGNIKIKNLKLNGVYGTLTGSYSTYVYILCGSGGCSTFPWTGLSMTGAANKDSCNFAPTGYVCKV